MFVVSLRSTQIEFNHSQQGRTSKTNTANMFPLAHAEAAGDDITSTVEIICQTKETGKPKKRCVENSVSEDNLRACGRGYKHLVGWSDTGTTTSKIQRANTDFVLLSSV